VRAARSKLLPLLRKDLLHNSTKLGHEVVVATLPLIEATPRRGLEDEMQAVVQRISSVAECAPVASVRVRYFLQVLVQDTELRV